MTLTEFLLARFAEDKAVALIDAAEMKRSSITIQFDCETQERFDPARVLAECEAKRRIVAIHGAAWHVCPNADGRGYADWSEGDDGMGPCPTLRLLALPYADHPDYLPEWKP